MQPTPYSSEALQDIDALFRRQILFYAQAQDQILEEAKALTKAFYAFQKNLSHQIRKDTELREWSDLSISVRKLRGYVTIQWRVRMWYKSTRDGRKGFNAKHLGKRKNSTNYKQSLAKVASAAEYQTVMDLEDRFVTLRHWSVVIHEARKHMLQTAATLGIAIKDDPAYLIGQESAPVIHERIGNLLLLLRYRLWPEHSEADLQAGFIPLIDPRAGLTGDVDAQAAHATLQKLEQDYTNLGHILRGKTHRKNDHPGSN